LKPEEMWRLRKQLCGGLRSLNLDGVAGIAKLPNLVASVTGLSSISLLGTRLREFPAELCQLTLLESLALGRQGPDARLEMQGSLERLGAFQLLTELKLRDVGLTELSWSPDSSEAPPWPRLRTLQVDENKLTELPAWLTRLTLLEVLDVSGNELNHLPDFDPDHSQRADIASLANELEKLGMHSKLGRLLETRGLQPPLPLKSLNVQRNMLTALPLSLVHIRGTLTTLVANPLKNPRKNGEGEKLRPLRVPPEEVLARHFLTSWRPCWRLGNKLGRSWK
jgi:Leucine-rich repeat (LRR) protein